MMKDDPSDGSRVPTARGLDAPARGTNGGRARAHNRRLLLARIRAHGPMGRAEIARLSGLSTQAVSNIVEGLEADGLLVPAGIVRRGRGLPTQRYGLASNGGRAIGLELRPGAVLCAALDLNGTPVASGREVLTDPRPEPAAAVAARLVARIDEASAAHGPVLGLGAALPGPFGPTGLAPEGGELPGWSEIDAGDHLANALGQPVVVTKDTIAAATAERVGGAARGLGTFAHLYFGAGIGLALVADGEPMRGCRGNAGEIGRMPAGDGPDGPLSLEDAASRIALARRLEKAGIAAGSFAALEAAIDHPATVAWLREAAPAVARALRWIECIADPETVVLGGALPAPLLKRLIAAVEPPRLSVAERPDRPLPRLVVGRCGSTVAAEGAAALALDAADAPPRMTRPATDLSTMEAAE